MRLRGFVAVLLAITMAAGSAYGTSGPCCCRSGVSEALAKSLPPCHRAADEKTQRVCDPSSCQCKLTTSEPREMSPCVVQAGPRNPDEVGLLSTAIAIQSPDDFAVAWTVLSTRGPPRAAEPWQLARPFLL